MGAPLENKNAIGNGGGRPYSLENREKAAVFKGLVLDECIRLMHKGSSKERRDLVLRVIAACLPKEAAFLNDQGHPLPMPILCMVRGMESSVHSCAV